MQEGVIVCRANFSVYLHKLCKSGPIGAKFRHVNRKQEIIDLFIKHGWFKQMMPLGGMYILVCKHHTSLSISILQGSMSYSYIRFLALKMALYTWSYVSYDYMAL